MRLTRNKREREFLAFTSKEFQIESDSLNLKTEYRSLANWSSLNALIFVAAIHDKYGVLITSSELSKSKTLRDLYALIYKIE